MTDRPNISTEYEPKGSDRNQSDTLDKPANEKAPGTSEAAKKEPEDPGFATNGE
jgi:hypothetical protein